MALGCEVNDAIDLVFLHQTIHHIEVADVALYKGVVGLVLDIFEVGEVTRIGQLVKVNDVVLGVLVYEEENNMRADKTCTARDDYVAFESYIYLVF
jgi:hypothetical protein